MVDDYVEARRPARSSRDDTSIEALSENLLAAVGLLASEPTSDEVKANAAASTGQIRNAANVAAVDAMRSDVQSGKAAAADTALAEIRIVRSSGLTFSTEKPDGINDECWSFWRMLLTLLTNQRRLISGHHQM